MKDLFVHGIPEAVTEVDAAVFRTRILHAAEDLRQKAALDDIGIIVSTRPALEDSQPAAAKSDNEFNAEVRAEQYLSTKPLWHLDQLVAPAELIDEIGAAIDLMKLEPLVFGSWGLRAIEPFPRSALNFHGAPGTGKTMTAHAVAAELRKDILVASYAQIESKYHGDGPKNVEALFHAAQRDDAVLFIDEADSLLSKRLTEVTQGSDQAINSMRSQILICLEKYRGVVIFATNLVENYDRGFETRVRHIHFSMPDAAAREAIWRKHLLPSLPLASDVDPVGLANAEEEFCGRDIKNAVINAAIRVARSGRGELCQDDLVGEVKKIVAARGVVRKNTSSTGSMPVQEKEDLEMKVSQGLQPAGMAGQLDSVGDSFSIPLTEMTRGEV